MAFAASSSSSSSVAVPSSPSYHDNPHRSGGSRRRVRGPQRSRWKQKRRPSRWRQWCSQQQQQQTTTTRTGLLLLAFVGLCAVLSVALGAVFFFLTPHETASTTSRVATASGASKNRNVGAGYRHRHHIRGKNIVNLEQEHLISPSLDRGPKQQEDESSASFEQFRNREPEVDAVVVGTGLAGLTVALRLLDRGATVALIEKEPSLGGNSNKASSGINACCLPEDKNNDTLAIFLEDTLQSAGDAARLPLIDVLVNRSAEAVTWLRQRGGVDLSQLVQLGGHSRARSHRPATGFVGVELINALYGALESYKQHELSSATDERKLQRPQLRLLLGTKVTELQDDVRGHVLGVRCEHSQSQLAKKLESSFRIRSDNVVLATGGFASDRSHGSFLEQYRPELVRFPATAGQFSTGDGTCTSKIVFYVLACSVLALSVTSFACLFC